MHTVLKGLRPVLALALAACRVDSTGGPVQASLVEADDPPRFSDWSAPVNLGPPVNSVNDETGAAVSKDGLSLYFVSFSRPGLGGFDIWVSRRTSLTDPWGPPQNLGPPINTASDETAPTLSIDGHHLYFASTRLGGFGGNDLYVSRRRDKRDDFGWRPAENLGSGVNSTAADAQATLFEDDAGVVTLYFNSTRLGGSGMDDIYTSTLASDGTFRPAVLVPELSTDAIDRQPIVRRDGLEIFLGSDRTGTHGAIDVWVSTRASTSDPWSAPVNLGPAINTSLIDARPALSFDGTVLLFQSTRPGAVGCPTAAANCPFDLWVIRRSKLKDPD